MANFKWQLDPVTKLPVNVTVRANKKLIFSIIGLKPVSSSPGPAVISSHSTVQWPIYPPGTLRPANDKPLIINQTIDTGSGAVGVFKADRAFVDALAFTGDAAMRGLFDVKSVILSAPEGSTATLTNGGSLTCP
jgi:hypothetical protein